MTVRTSRPARTASDGFILVAVLWILGALATLASIYTIYVANTAIAVAGNDGTVEIEALTSAAIELTAYRLLEAPKESRPTRGAFNFRLGHANAAVDFCSEAARIDLNEAPKELLAGLFAALGAHPNDAAQYADRVIGWRTTPRSEAHDKEAPLYSAAGLNYGPRGAPFEHVGELSLVLGLPPDMVERALPYVTVFSGREEVNVHDAAPMVLAALPGMTPERLRGFSAASGVQSASPSGSQRASAEAFLTTEGSDAIRVTVRIGFDNSRRVTSEVVILLGEGDEPFHVLSWQADIDALPNSGRVTGLRP
jgi:general secretion pathway protein K